MFSFFKKKTPEVSPSEEAPIPGADSQPNDFVIIENKTPDPNQPYGTNQNNRYMYPTLPAPQYLVPNIPVSSSEMNRQQANFNNLDGVPFNLSHAISNENSFESQQSHVDHILATITRSISIDETKEYDFSLERNVMGI